VLLRGNHDATRDMERATSFDVLALILREYGVIVVDEKPEVVCIDGATMAFVPWHPIITAQEMVAGLPPLDAAFGHWDVDPRSKPHNMIPELDTKLYVTGHDHKRRIEERYGKPVLLTGAMVPLAHGEDWTGNTYRTVTLAELNSIPVEEIRSSCVRVVLLPGEELPEIDAFQVSVLKPKTAEEDVGEVSLEGLDMHELFQDVCVQFGVNAELSSTLFEKYQER
jgi:hypothetical protein